MLGYGAHLLLLDGVYVDNWRGTWFRWVKAPTSTELMQLSHIISHHVSRFLERLGPRFHSLLAERMAKVVKHHRGGISVKQIKSDNLAR